MRTARFLATGRNFLGRRVPTAVNRECRRLETKAARWNSRTGLKALSTKIDMLSSPADIDPFVFGDLTFEEDDDGT